MAGAIAVLMMLRALFALMLGGRAHPFNAHLARTRVRRLSGPNFTMMIAVAGLSALLLKAAEVPIVASHPGVVPIIVAVAVLLVIGYVVFENLTRLTVGGIGVALLVLTEGLASTIGLVILAVFLLWLLGAARAWFG